MAPENTNVMDALADVLIQLGQAQEAEELLVESTELAPDANPCKWLFLAQLRSGNEALQTYRTGMDYLTRQLHEVETGKGAVRGTTKSYDD
jgi:predicted Zn-dependent protease